MLKLGLCGISTAILWLTTFQSGLLISSKPFRDEISRGHLTVRNFSWALVTYTITNIAYLCWLAGIAGAMGHWILTPLRTLHADTTPELRLPSIAEVCGLAVLRGFLVYLLFLAGVFISTSNPFEYTQEQYARMAGTISILSFLVNYEPSFFGFVIGWLKSQHETQASTTTPGSPSPPGVPHTASAHNGLAQQHAKSNQ